MLLRVVLCVFICLQFVNNAFVAALTPTLELSPIIYKNFVYSSCKSNDFDYYDTNALTCKKCSVGMIADQDSVNALGDPTQCKCAVGYKKTEVNCYSAPNGSNGLCQRFTCTLCNSGGNNVAYSDNSDCTICSAPAVYDATLNECTCSTGNYLNEVDALTGGKSASKTCSPCAAGTQVVVTDKTIAGQFYRADRYSCRSCPSDHMSMDASFVCTCDAGYTQMGSSTYGPLSCVLTNMAAEFVTKANVAARISYSKELVVVSDAVTHYFVKAAAECKYYGGASDISACQILANLCVLHLYDRSKAPCSEFLSIINERGNQITNDVMQWNLGMPWLYMSLDACNGPTYRQQASLNTQLLRYVIGSYTMNGTFNGYQPLDNFFSYCSRRAPHSEGSGTSDKWQVFGASSSDTWKCDLDTLLGQEQLFYEMYLYDPAAETAYLPIPVRIVNMTDSGAVVNPVHPSDTCTLGDLLVRRFMLFDVISGLTASSSKIPTVIRYAADITVELKLNEDDYKLLNPVLSIFYGISETGSWPVMSSEFNADGTIIDKAAITARTAQINFSGRYTQDFSSFTKIFYTWSIITGVFCGLHALLRYNNWYVRNSRLNSPGSVSMASSVVLIWNLGLKVISSWVYFYFPIQVIICWYFFTFFKLQGVPDNLLPATDDIYGKNSDYYIFSANITLMAIFQVVYCLWMIYCQCNADTFFLDWEPQSGGAKGDTGGGRVSVWRTIFVANEWTEMTTMRKIDVRINLVLLAFILVGCDQQYAATQQPDVSDLSPGKTNMVLRFANTTFWWLILSGAQWLWKFLIYERFLSETPEQLFIDFCTIAKVSIVVLDEAFHGYYLHCRSPHQHADGTMVELVEMLHKEEAGLTVDRSLDGGPADCQSFQMFMTAEWKSAFSKIYNNLTREPNVGEILGAGRKSRPFGRGPTGGAASAAMSPRADSKSAQLPNDKTLKAWRELNVFLQEFVENNFGKPGLRRSIREPTYWEIMAELAPDLSLTDTPNLFFPDRNNDYTKVLFLGRELELLLCNIMVFSAVDMWSDGNTLLAVVCTYAVDWFFCYVRGTYGRAVTSAKSLIDERFLM